MSGSKPEDGHGSLTVLEGQDEPCAYLPDQTARMVYQRFSACPEETYLALLERGWRRFGEVFFRPACAACTECRSLRLDVEAFRASRSQKRIWKRNQDLEVRLSQPRLTREHLALYHRYHRDMARRRDWPLHRENAEDYFHTFVLGQGAFGRELSYRLEGRLVAVALTDLLPGAASAVYCYYDPALRARGLGTYSILRQVSLARERGFAHLYLGYWIEGNASMRYKARYHPHQILRGRPGPEAVPRWAGLTPGRNPPPSAPVQGGA